MAAKRKSTRMIFDPGDDDYREPTSEQIRSRTTTAVKVGQAIRELQSEVEGAQQLNTEAMDYFIGLYDGTIPLGIPNNKRYVQFDARTAKPADIIHRTIGMLITPLKAQYISPKDSGEDDALATIIMSHLEGAYEWLKRKHGQLFDHQSLFWQALVGRSYIQQTYSPSYWNKRPEKAKEGESDGDFNARVEGFKGYQGPPFTVESLDPRIVYPIPTNMGTHDWLKKYTVQRFDAEGAFERATGEPFAFEVEGEGKIKSILRGKNARQYKLARQRNPGGTAATEQAMRGRPGLEQPVGAMDTWSGNVEYHEYIDSQNVYYVCEDRVVWQHKHAGGIKIATSQGLVTGFKEFERQAVSLLFAVRHEIPQFDFLRTLWVNRAYIDVFPQLFVELAGDEEPLKRSGTDENEVWDVEPMTVKQVRGRITNPFTDAQSGTDFRSAVEMMASDIDLATLSPLARGIGGAQQAGYSINQLSQAMRTMWKPLIESRELQWSTLFEHYLWCVKHLIKERVTVFAEIPTDRGVTSGQYLSLDPEDIQDFYQVRATLKPDLPIDQQAEMLSWMKAGAEGRATDQEVSLYGFGQANWIERRNRVERDQMRRAALAPAIEAAMKLGNVQLENQIAQEMGYDQLNPAFSQSLESMRTPGPPGTPNAGPGVTPIDPSAGIGEGNGIAPTAGANPTNPQPAARM